MLTEACSIRDLALVFFAVFLSVAQSNLVLNIVARVLTHT